MRKFLMVPAAALVLAGCSGDEEKAGKTDGTPNITAPAKSSMDAISIKPGLWETKITFKAVEANGLPAAAKQQMVAAMGKGVTVKSCVTKQQSDKPGAEFFGSPNSSNCTIDRMNASGGKMTVALTCKPDAKTVITSNMTGQFAADNYSMDVQQRTSGTPIGDLITTGKIDGKRLGDCPAEERSENKP